MSTAVEDETVVDCRALTDACLLLFGEDTTVSPEFIHYMQIAGLKAAFRNLAMRNHPDLASQMGVSSSELQRRFMALRRAYELLVPYVSGEKELPPWNTGARASCRRQTPPRPDFSRRAARPGASAGATGGFRWGYSRAQRPENPRPGAGRRQTFYHGALPEKELRFGEYLYYRGIVAWEDMFAALVWQRLNRPRLGEIALEKGLLTADNMLTIRRCRRPGEMLGAAATRLGLLNEAQLRMLLGFQRLHNCALGRYFVDNAIFPAPRLNELLREHCSHNLRFRVKPPVC